MNKVSLTNHKGVVIIIITTIYMAP